MGPKQYEDLIELCRQLKGEPFTLLAAPCNQFLSQSPGTTEQLYKFVLNKFAKSEGSFLVLEKLEVNGRGTHPIYHYLKRFSPDLYKQHRCQSMPVPWNFSKFLLDRSGKVITYQGPSASALDLEPIIREQFAMANASGS